MARTVVVLAVRPDEERGALERCAGRSELGDLGNVGGEGRGVTIRQLGRVRLVAHARTHRVAKRMSRTPKVVVTSRNLRGERRQ